MKTPATTTEVATEIRTYVIDRFLFGQDGDAPANSDSFLERNLMDSTGVLELVAFLEQRYGIKLADDELVPENLDSVDRIAAFVTRRQS
jgi:acyl carrier protein